VPSSMIMGDERESLVGVPNDTSRSTHASISNSSSGSSGARLTAEENDDVKMNSSSQMHTQFNVNGIGAKHHVIHSSASNANAIHKPPLHPVTKSPPDVNVNVNHQPPKRPHTAVQSCQSFTQVDETNVPTVSANPNPPRRFLAHSASCPPSMTPSTPRAPSPPNRMTAPGPIPYPSSPSPSGGHDIVERSPEERYVRFTEKLGSGAYKSVYRAYDTIEGIEVAWNVVNLSGMPKSDRARIVNEVRLLERLHHPNIISFHGSWVNRESEQVLFVTEILSSGTLKRFINKVQVIRWKIAKRWACQILKGLEYLHSHNPPIIHRDLKCDNIFINGTSGDLRIGDFGLSTMISNRNRALSVLGTPEFMAPELYDESYDEKVDIYAFGMCLLEIFTKEAPYSECTNPAQIYKKVTNGIPPASLKRLKSRDAREFIELCLDGVNNKRPSATELLKHPFLQECDYDESEVEVESTMMEGIIKEGNSAGANSRVDTITQDKQVSSAGTLEKMEEDNPDQYSAMSDTGMNVKKVKVIMGRPADVENDNVQMLPVQPVAPPSRGISEPPSGSAPAVPASVSLGPSRISMVSDFGSEHSAMKDDTAMYATQPESTIMSAATSHPLPQPQPQPADNKYLVDACVIEKPNDVENNYADDVMKLIITLPIQGQTQNVQFDFHLVEDDPVQVAREMVTELHIPETAVLEISETISGLARAARVKQNRYRALQQQMQQQQQQQQQQQNAATQMSNVQNATDSAQPMLIDPIVTQPGLVRQHPSATMIATPPVPVQHIDPTTAAPPRIRTQPQHQPLTQHQLPPQQPQPQASTIPKLPIPSESQQPTQVNVNVSSATSTPRTPHQKQQHPEAIQQRSQPIKQVSIQNASKNPHRTAAPTTTPMEPPCDSSIDSDDSNTSELRRLEEEYQKNLQRARKAFVTRMDNLQRSMKDKEEQHQKTLEKHEKDLAEFEKRLKLAEAEQQRRLDALEKEWKKQRDGMKQRKNSEQRVKNENKGQGMVPKAVQQGALKPS